MTTDGVAPMTVANIWHYDNYRLGRLRMMRSILHDNGNPTMVEELDEAIRVLESVVRAKGGTP